MAGRLSGSWLRVGRDSFGLRSIRVAACSMGIDSSRAMARSSSVQGRFRGCWAGSCRSRNRRRIAPTDDAVRPSINAASITVIDISQAIAMPSSVMGSPARIALGPAISATVMLRARRISLRRCRVCPRGPAGDATVPWRASNESCPRCAPTAAPPASAAPIDQERLSARHQKILSPQHKDPKPTPAGRWRVGAPKLNGDVLLTGYAMATAGRQCAVYQRVGAVGAPVTVGSAIRQADTPGRD